MKHAPWIVGAVLLAFAVGSRVVAQQAAPPNAPARHRRSRATASWSATTARPVFDGRIQEPGSAPRRGAVRLAAGRGGGPGAGARSPRAGQSRSPGTVTASAEAFPCESDRPVRALPVVRHSSGPSRSRLNQAVYDRRWDWVLSVDDQPRTAVTVTPVSDGAEHRTFTLERARQRDRPAVPAAFLPAAPRAPVLRALDLRRLEPARRRLVQLVRVLRQGHRRRTCAARPT